MIAKLFWFCTTTILYTYLGYPLLLTLLARTRSTCRMESSNLPLVTVLIAAYNEQDMIGQKLENTLALDYPIDKLQILVAADGSSDWTKEIILSYRDRGVELSYSPSRRGKMAAINRAMSLARGDVVLFSDANNFYRPDVLKELVRSFGDPTVGAATGAKVIIKGDGFLSESEGLYWKYESFIKQEETRLGSCIGAAGEVFAIRRELFEPPPDYIINDDFYMAMRLMQRGYRVVYVPTAQSFERVSPSAQAEMARRSRIVAGRYQAMALAGELMPWWNPLAVWQVVSHKYLRPLVPQAMIGAFITNAILTLRTGHSKRSSLRQLTPPFARASMVLQLLFYSLAWLGNRVERKGKLGKLLYIPTFLVNSNLAALSGAYRFMTGEQTTLWQRVPRWSDNEAMPSWQRLQYHGDSDITSSWQRVQYHDDGDTKSSWQRSQRRRLQSSDFTVIGDHFWHE